MITCYSPAIMRTCSSDPRAGQAVASLQRNSSALNTALLSLQSKLQPTSAALDNIESLIQEQVLESLGASVSSLLNTTTATHTALQPLLTGLKAFISSKPGGSLQVHLYRVPYLVHSRLLCGIMSGAVCVQSVWV
jgi:hypothetical protein